MFNLVGFKEDCRIAQEGWEKKADYLIAKAKTDYLIAKAKAEVYEIIGLKLDLALSPPTIREYNSLIDDGNCAVVCPFQRDHICTYHLSDREYHCNIPLEICDESWIGTVLLNVETEELVYNPEYSPEDRPTP